jgi:hypothetical protein
LQGCIPGVSKLFYNGLVGRVSHEDFYGTVDPLLCSSSLVKCEAQNGKNVSESSRARNEIPVTRNACSGDLAKNRHESCGDNSCSCNRGGEKGTIASSVLAATTARGAAHIFQERIDNLVILVFT